MYVQDYGAVDYLRLRVIPVLGTSPSIFGQALASYALCTLGGKPYDPDTGERMSKNLKHKVRQVLKKDEVKIRAHIHTYTCCGLFSPTLKIIVRF